MKKLLVMVFCLGLSGQSLAELSQIRVPQMVYQNENDRGYTVEVYTMDVVLNKELIEMLGTNLTPESMDADIILLKVHPLVKHNNNKLQSHTTGKIIRFTDTELLLLFEKKQIAGQASAHSKMVYYLSTDKLVLVLCGKNDGTGFSMTSGVCHNLVKKHTKVKLTDRLLKRAKEMS